MPSYRIRVNGRTQQVNTDADTPLLWVLRDELGLTGSKYGCGQGLCGACTVHVAGRARRSCQLPIAELKGEVTSIEGLDPQGEHPLQQAWVAHDVAQCGFCQCGQIMQAAALLRENPRPTAEQIDAAMAGNLCRCGTQLRIRAAIQAVASAGGKP